MRASLARLALRFLAALAAVVLGEAAAHAASGNGASAAISLSALPEVPRDALRQAAERLRDLLPPGAQTAHGSLEARLLADACDGRLDAHGLLEAALIAGGVADEHSLAGYRRKFAACREALRGSGALQGSELRRAQELLEYLHRQVLVGGYRADATHLGLALDEGVFNCASATVLYNCLGEQLGLRVAAVEGLGHAASVLYTSEGALQVETTCPEWFQIRGSEELRRQALARVTAAPEGVPWPGTRRVIGDLGLVAVIYYNRGVDHLAGKRFAEAAQANLNALHCDPANAAARRNLAAAINNWAVDASASADYARAVALLDAALAIDPACSPLRANYTIIRQRWARSLPSHKPHQHDLGVPGATGPAGG